MRQLDDLLIEEDDTVRVQPCVSPIWDTAITTIALADADLPAYHPALLRSVRWLLEQEVRGPGDWADRGHKVEPTGWHFQYRNDFYPDLDDTAMVILALQRTSLADSPEVKAATERGVDWLLAMQNRDGGWAAYDRDIDNQVLTKVPFADHNAMLDPSCADITMRVVELLGVLGYRADHPAIARALDYLWQDPGAAGLLVRPLGGQLHLRDLAGPPGPRRDRLPDGPPRTSAGPSTGSSRSSRSTAAGASRRLSYDDPSLDGPRRADRLADRLGRPRPVAAGPGQERGRPPGRRSSSSTRQAADGTWVEARLHRAPASRGSSTSSTTSTGSTSR